MFKRLGLFLALVAGLSARASASVITVGFDGAGYGATVGNYYNGGMDSQGNSGPNYGISFVGDGGLGGKVDTAANYPQKGLTANVYANVAAGFTTGFATDYIHTQTGFNITVYSGLDKTGSVLVSQNINGDVGTGGVTFAGTALSVAISRANSTGDFDNLTFGSSTVGVSVESVPEPSTLAIGGLVALIGGGVAWRRRRAIRTSRPTGDVIDPSSR